MFLFAEKGTFEEWVGNDVLALVLVLAVVYAAVGLIRRFVYKHSWKKAFIFRD